MDELTQRFQDIQDRISEEIVNEIKDLFIRKEVSASAALASLAALLGHGLNRSEVFGKNTVVASTFAAFIFAVADGSWKPFKDSDDSEYQPPLQ